MLQDTFDVILVNDYFHQRRLRARYHLQLATGIAAKMLSKVPISRLYLENDRLEAKYKLTRS